MYTGLRPGEKLYEEKLMAEEGMTTTPNQLIHIGKPIPFDMEQFMRQLDVLAAASFMNTGYCSSGSGSGTHLPYGRIGSAASSGYL